jgi:hypothetical protein
MLDAGTAQRRAELKLERRPSGPTLVARLPLELSEGDFVQVARSSYALIHKLTGCNCLSGRISFVVEDVFEEVIQVNLTD